MHLRLAKRDPTNIDWQRDLAAMYGKIGAAVQSMDGELPAEYHEELAVRKKLFEKDETNTLWTRELAMTFDEIGAQLIPLGKINAARAAYTDGRGVRIGSDKCPMADALGRGSSHHRKILQK